MRIERDSPIRAAMRVFWLLVLVVLIGSELAGHATRVQVGGGAALAVAATGWFGWSRARNAQRVWATMASFAALGCAGAVLALWTGPAIAFFVVVGIAAAGTFDLRTATAITAAGPLVLAVLAFGDNRGAGLALGGAAAGLGGLLGGIGRRQGQDAQLRSTQLAVAREVHDLLAHTLAAVAVQLEAADAVLADGGDPARLRQMLGRSRQLVRDGIEETRAAVTALRDEPVELVERLASLIAAEPVELRISGEPRQLPPKSGLALYRAAQEALTNARRHAPGAPLTIALAFGPEDVVLSVENGTATAPSTGGGGGFGLQGMRERLELVGGALTAGATESGWHLEARVPA